MKDRVLTTVVGAYPKPAGLAIPNWFESDESTYNPDDYTKYFQSHTQQQIETELNQATCQVIQLQKSIGIDIITNGELRRENYIHYFCRHLNGVSFDLLSHRKIRNDNHAKSLVPTIVGPISLKSWSSTIEWNSALNLFPKRSKIPMKIALPGPITILDTVANNYYQNPKQACIDLSRCLRAEVLNLVKLGCKYIQIDEPVMARKIDLALDYGITNLNFILKDLPNDVTTIVHICCGYPNYLDQDNYQKADNQAYLKLIPKLDKCKSIDVISIEDAERTNDLNLFKLFKTTKVQLGVIKIARTQIETVEEIEARIKSVLSVLKNGKQQLLVSPDCGLGLLPSEICYQKLKNMVKAVENINNLD